LGKKPEHNQKHRDREKDQTWKLAIKTKGKRNNRNGVQGTFCNSGDCYRGRCLSGLVEWGGQNEKTRDLGGTSRGELACDGFGGEANTARQAIDTLQQNGR